MASVTINVLPVFFHAITQRPPSKKKNEHEKALEEYQAAYAKYEKERTKLLEPVETA